MIDVCKCVNGLSNSITNQIYSKRNVEHNVRNYRELVSHRKLTSLYGLESVISHLRKCKASHLW